MVITWHNNTISSTSHVYDIRSDHITAYVHVCISWQCTCCEGVCHSGRQSFSLLRSCCDTMHGAWLSVLFASPATRQGCDHFFHDATQCMEHGNQSWLPHLHRAKAVTISSCLSHLHRAKAVTISSMSLLRLFTVPLLTMSLPTTRLVQKVSSTRFRFRLTSPPGGLNAHVRTSAMQCACQLLFKGRVSPCMKAGPAAAVTQHNVFMARRLPMARNFPSPPSIQMFYIMLYTMLYTMPYAMLCISTVTSLYSELHRSTYTILSGMTALHLHG